MTSDQTQSLTHLDRQGKVKMVDVGEKPITARSAVARGRLAIAAQTAQLIADGKLPKGDVVAVARIAGIQAAKRTAELIPLCHPLPLTHVSIDITLADPEPAEQPSMTPAEAPSDEPAESYVTVTATVKTTAQTGVEMEALTAATVALLTLYDMTKAVDKRMRLEGIHVVEKHGGRSDWPS